MERKKAILLATGASLLVGACVLFYNYRKQIKYYSNVLIDRAKLKLVGRTINKIIIHCSATKPNQACTVELIDQWHRQRGFNSIGYHFVIYQDGTLHEGRALSEIGAHCVGQNSDSIGICYVGGLDSNGKATDTRTEEQRETLKKVVAELKEAYGDIPVYGHNEFANKACPCFDVEREFR